ncbi:hypothetical protein SPRG_11779 [Saprolegnia parasitica CBS 223.65]|uniref:SnoaL-like domain-containing protein n=1 Tax=Saprolegnia parasitica (strain CBS 223.65) TaxID=695850 RepID=A0A067C1D8_SAPPC|nr:hypothetical protein SPRG_11779 [Saprolegnia parasitica CBS 223.65]KDO22935.1 hypothetical protein SPRG_11779 [Saprolegnia parasitica CBS 223.65]|eukprot:XP_012206371.1 hypothetical protein SPRG_11779 [Saprolegnia parasitica CBS 223.65]
MMSKRRGNGKDGSKPEMGMAQRMTLKILSLYDSTTNVDAIIQELYHPEATFSDPLVEVSGRDKVAAQFRVLPSFVAQSHATLIRGSMAGVSILTIDSTVTYKLKPFPEYMGGALRMFTVIELEDQKVISHTDHWDIRSVLENVPMLSFFYRHLRTSVGSASSHVINVFLPESSPPSEETQLLDAPRTDHD